MITLYDKLGTTKLGELNNCIDCFVEEERNGIFELSLTCPISDPIHTSLVEENIIVANANDTLLNQKFRIYLVKKLMENEIVVYARHISFDLAHDVVNIIDITNQSCEYALNTIFRQSQFSTHYRGYSDIVNAQDYKISMCNCIEAIAGKEGSVIDTYGTGAEILRDNVNIHVLNKRGHDNGVTIEYAKNLTGFELEEDITDLITRIIPYAMYTNSETNEEVEVRSGAVDSPLINNYSHPYISYIDYSDKFGEDEIPTVSKLQTLAQNEYRDNKVDTPKQNYKIEFIPLSKCVGYEGLEDKISLCDTVTIKDTRYNINTQAKVIKTVFDVLKNRYDSMELGEPRTTLGDIIGGTDSGKGEQGPPGPQGPPGEDGNIGDFPNSLPSTPILTSKLYGFASIELNWTYENKVYYNYELYASKTKDFTPNVFDLIHAGQTSSFLFQAKPNETWYFRVCCVNTHGNRTEFSSQVAVATKKVDDLSNYVDNMAINDALIGTLSLDRGWVGQLRGHWIDAKNLSVTDGNGKRTLYIDSFGNVNIAATNISMIVDGQDQGVATQSQVQQASDRVQFRFEEAGGYNRLRNSAFKDGTNHWHPLSWNSVGWNPNAFSGLEVRQIGDDLAILNRNTLSAYASNLSTNTWETLGVGFDSEPLWGGRDWTFSCLLASHRTRNIIIEVIEHDSSGNRLPEYNTWVIEGNKSGGQFRDNWHKFERTFSLKNEGCANFVIRIFMGSWNGEMNSAYLFMAEPMLTLGHKGNLPYTPNADELYAGITTIDKDGVKVQHEMGSYSRLNYRELYQANEYGQRTISLRSGGLRTYQFNHNEDGCTGFLGGVTPTVNPSNGAYGNSIFGSGHASFLSLGFTDNYEDNNGGTLSTWLSFVRYNGALNSKSKQGINVWKPLYLQHELYTPYTMYFISPDDSINSEKCHIGLNAKATEGSRTLLINGADQVNLNVVNGGIKSGHRIIEDGSAVGVRHEAWGNWNFNGWTISNVNVSKSLNDITSPVGSKNRVLTREAYPIYSPNQIIQVRGEEFTSNGICIIEIPDDIKYSIEKYDVNIIKYGKGDIWVSERTYDYFVVESENDIRFTWILEGIEIEKIRAYSYGNESNRCDDEMVEPVINDVNLLGCSNFAFMDDEQFERAIQIYKLKSKNELWRLYSL